MEGCPIPDDFFGRWIINLAIFTRVRHLRGGYEACRS